MSKNALILLVVIVVAALVSPVIDGYLFQLKILNYIASLNQVMNNKLVIQVDRYQQGWLTSYADFSVKSSNENFNYLDGLTVKNEITHGPLTYDKTNGQVKVAYALIKTALFPSVEWKKHIQGENGKALAFFNSVFHLNNTLSQTITTNAISTHHNYDPLLITSSLGSVELTNDSTITPTDIRFKGVGIVHGSVTGLFDDKVPLSIVDISPYSFNYDCVLSDTSLSQCTLNMDVPKVVEKSDKHDRFTLLQNNQTWVVRLDPDKKLYYDYGSLIGELKYKNQPIISNFQWQSSIGKISFNELLAYLELISSLQGNAALTSEQQSQWQDVLIKLFNQGSYFNFSVKMDTPKGKFDFENNLKVVSDLPKNNVDAIVNHISESLQITVASSVFEYAVKAGMVVSDVCLPSILQSLIQTGVVDGNMFDDCANKVDLFTQVTPLPLHPETTQGVIPAENKDEATRASIARQALTKVGEWVQAAYLMQQGNNYVVNVTLNEGKLMINGVEKNLKELSKGGISRPAMVPSGGMYPSGIAPQSVESTLPAEGQRQPASPAPTAPVNPVSR